MDGREAEETLDATVERIKAQHPPLETQADQLRAFREHLGEEMWATLSSNPSLMEMVQNFCRERAVRAANEMIDALVALAPAGQLTREDVASAIFSTELS